MKQFIILIWLILSFAFPGHSLAGKNNTAAGFIELGVKFYEKMQYEKAKGYFELAKKSEPRREQIKFISYALGVLEEYSAKLKEVEDINIKLQQATSEVDKKNLIDKLKESHLEIGRRLSDERGYAPIIKAHFNYIILEDPANLQAHLYLGDINYSGMLYEEAIKNYTKALEMYPDNPFFQQRLGDIYAGTGVYDKAKECYEKAIGLFRKSRLEDKKERIGRLERFIGKMPTSLDEIKKLMDSRQYENVLSICRKRIAMNPSDTTAITYMGTALEELGQWQKAEALYKTAIKRNRDYPPPHFYLAKIYLMRHKNADKAIAEMGVFKETLEELLEIDRQAKEALIAAQHTLVYIYHEILRDYKTAVRESQYLLELAPEDQEAHYNLALSYAYLNKKSMAYDEFRKVIDINPDTKIARFAKNAIESLARYPNMRTLPYRRMEE